MKKIHGFAKNPHLIGEKRKAQNLPQYFA